LPALTASLSGLDRESAVAVYCAGGTRSHVAASVMRRAGFIDVSDVLGGFTAWQVAGLPVATGDTPSAAPVPEISARRASSMLDNGGMLLDVREPDEWQTGHAPGATLLAMGEVQSRRDELPRDRPVVVVCRSGGRSAAVTQSLRSWGFDAANLSGGMCAWAAAGLPTVVPEPDLSGLVVHRTRPLNCETSLPALVGGVVMPNARFYVRNHFDTPRLDPATWRLRVGGHVERPLELSFHDLHRLPSHTLVATLECAGNGRSTFDPPVPGDQWHYGAVSTAEWTGVPLVEVLDRVGPRPGASDVVFAGADHGEVEGYVTPIRFERGLALDDAASAGAVLAYAMNGDPLPLEHGAPVRLIVPGWYAVASVKWLTNIEVTDTAFDGYFQFERYCFLDERDGVTVHRPVRYQRVRALITEPDNGAEISPGDVAIRGVAWSGAAPIERVELSIGGAPWQPARLVGEAHAHSWQWWELLARIASAPETVVVRARATDQARNVQPERPEWNPLGYGGNAIQAIGLHVH